VTTSVFDAWQVPAWFDTPAERVPVVDQGDIPVRTLDGGPGMVQRLVAGLAARRESLLARPVASVVETLGSVAARFLDPGDPLRAETLEVLPGTSGLSPPMAEAVLDGMASDWTTRRLRDLLASEFPDPAVLDTFVPGSQGRLRAMSPGVCVQIVAGSVPGVGTTALVRSLMTKAPTLLKPGRGDVALPVLFARAVEAVDPELGQAVAVVYWQGGQAQLEGAALREAGVVTAYGGDEAVRSIRSRTPVSARFVPYPHRVSFGVVGRDALTPARIGRTAAEAAGAVSFFDQRGCVSPHVLFVEGGGSSGAEQFARELASALGVLEGRLPGGALAMAESARLQQERGAAELRAAAGENVLVLHGGAASWTVIYDPGAAFAPSCTGRFVRVRPVSDIRDVTELVSPAGRHLQTAGVAGCGDRLVVLAEELARVGVTRIAPFSDLPFPPPWWHHDGGGPLASLVRWVDLQG
jgi:hypothetical protein